MRKNNLKISKKPLTSAEKYDIILKLSENSGQDIEKKYKKAKKLLDKAEEI